MSDLTGFDLAGVVFVIALGALILWWARSCGRGTFRRNWLIGYRTPLTLRDHDAWLAVHRSLAPYLVITGSGMIVCGLIAAGAVWLGGEALALVLLESAIVWLLLWCLISVFPAHRAARAYARSV